MGFEILLLQEPYIYSVWNELSLSLELKEQFLQ